jgi:hypothetical protein
MDPTTIKEDFNNPEAASPIPDETPAWEMIEAGRYRPHRIRGSYRGRELG